MATDIHKTFACLGTLQVACMYLCVEGVEIRCRNRDVGIIKINVGGRGARGGEGGGLT